MRDDMVAVLIAILTTLMASTGFWTYLAKHREKSSATTKLLMGLAHDRLSYVGMTYITRGYVTSEEYEDYRKYLYEPYRELGGNGMVERIMGELQKLPFLSPQDHYDRVRMEHGRRNANK